MTALVVLALLLAAASGTAVVFIREPKRQVLALSANGLILGFLFFVLQAPDVALSQIAVGTVITPLLFLATLAAVAINRKGS